LAETKAAAVEATSLGTADSNTVVNQKKTAETSFPIGDNALAKAKREAMKNFHVDLDSDAPTDNHWQKVNWQTSCCLQNLMSRALAMLLS